MITPAVMVNMPLHNSEKGTELTFTHPHDQKSSQQHRSLRICSVARIPPSGLQICGATCTCTYAYAEAAPHALASIAAYITRLR